MEYMYFLENFRVMDLSSRLELTLAASDQTLVLRMFSRFQTIDAAGDGSIAH